MNQVHSFLKKAQSVLKIIFIPADSSKKMLKQNVAANEKKETGWLNLTGNTFTFPIKRLRKNTAVLKKEPDRLIISAIEKSAFIAYQQNYIRNTKPFAMAQPANYYGQPQQLMITIQSGIRPLPLGMVAMLDFCQNSIQSSLI